MKRQSKTQIFALITAALLSGIAVLYPQNPNSAVFPSGVASDSDLLVANNNATTTLAVPINASVTTVTLTSASGFVTPLALSIDSEILRCTSNVGTAYTCSRGFNNTSAAAHGFRAIVKANFVSWHVNQTNAEVKAIESATPNTVSDLAYSNVSAACLAASGKQLTFSKAWTAVTSQTCAAKSVSFLSGGSIQPGSGQTVIFSGPVSGDLTQHFDYSQGGHVSIAGVQVLYTEWWGAQWDGATDDAAPWNNAIGACAACTIQMRTNASSKVASTINLSGAGQRLVGGGKTSIITGSGITLLKLSGAITGGQTAENFQLRDPTGSTSTILMLIDNGSGNANQVYVHNVTMQGNSGNRQGKGLVVNGCVNCHVNQLNEEYLDIGVQLNSTPMSPITVFDLTGSELFNNTTYGLDIEDTNGGDYRIFRSTMELAGIGLFANGGQITATANHYESNTTQVRCECIYIGTGDTFEGGAVLVGSTNANAVMELIKPVADGFTLTNNSGGYQNNPGAVVEDAQIAGFITIAGTGWTQVRGPSGITQYHNPNNQAYTFAGGPTQGYSFDQALTAPNLTTGTWTPVLSFGGASVGITYSLQTGTYVRVGKFYYCFGAIILTSKGSSTGGVIIGGLPAAAAGAMPITVSYYSGMASITHIGGYINSDTNIHPWNAGAGVFAALTDANFSNTSILQFAAMYQAP
jgi:hypothetical protein